MWFLVNRALTHWRVLLAGAACVVLIAITWQVQEWRWGERTAALERDWSNRNAAGWEAALRAYREAVAEGDRAARRADEAISRMKKDRDKWKTAYSEALESDPDCAAWAEGPIRCPVPQS